MKSDLRRIRIALLAEGGLWGGIETHIRNLIEGLHEAEAAIEISCLLFESGPVEEWVRTVNGLCSSRSPCRGRVRALRWLADELHTARPDLVHAHGFVAEILGGIVTWLPNTPPLLATVHIRPGRRLWCAEDRSSIASMALWASRRTRASRLIAVSEDLRRRLIQSGLPAHRIECVYNGVREPPDSDRIEGTRLRAQLGLARDSFVVGMVGRLERMKGHSRLLRIAARVRQQNPELRLLIAGDGPRRHEIEAEVKQLGLDRHAHLLGFRRDVGAVMAAMDLGVFASDHEGLPYAAIELMARGVPLLAFAVGGLREIMSHGQTGVLIPPGDEEALARELGALARDRKRLAALGRRAAEEVAARFSYKRMVCETERIWRKAVGECRES